MARSLLVTGGAGFIGANFTHFWSAQHRHDRIVVLDALTYAGDITSIEPLISSGGISFVEGDVRDFDLVLRLLNEQDIDTIVHFAAESHVDRSIANPTPFVSVNVLGSQTLLEAARHAWCAQGRSAANRFHHISTDEVYGSLGIEDAPFTESSPYAPSSPYAASKAGADHLVRAYARTYGLQCSISNCSNNYGPYQFPEKLIPLCLLAALHGQPLPIYGNGRNVRDWLHVHDHCHALEAILSAPEACGTWNVGGRSECSNIDLAHLLCRTIDAAFSARPELAAAFPDSPAARGEPCSDLIRFVADRPGHDFRYAIDPKAIESRLGFRPRIALESGIRMTVDWYLANADWWRRRRQRLAGAPQRGSESPAHADAGIGARLAPAERRP
jgi:dTDP-glucose 4,6-dehydratase